MQPFDDQPVKINYPLGDCPESRRMRVFGQDTLVCRAAVTALAGM
jgi:hypothetical protein